jgi:hypothetical protein
MAIAEWRMGSRPDAVVAPDILIPGQRHGQLHGQVRGDAAAAAGLGLGSAPLPSPNGSDPDESGDPHLAQVADG